MAIVRVLAAGGDPGLFHTTILGLAGREMKAGSAVVERDEVVTSSGSDSMGMNFKNG